MRSLLTGIAAGWLALSAPSFAAGVVLHVSAAASLSDVLREIGKAYRRRAAVDLQFNFAGSNLLVRQIQEGAPADLFISADEAKMDALEQGNLIVRDTRTDLLSNALAVIVAADSDLLIKGPADLVKARRIALADPRVVPAGIYAREYLEHRQLWSLLQPKIVPTENVRGALAAVESGNAEVGIVYRTDAALSKQVKVAWVIPPEEGPKIRYPVAVLKQAPEPNAARLFVRFLRSKEAAKIFERFGFVLATDPHGR